MKPAVYDTRGPRVGRKRAPRDAGEKALIALEVFTGCTALAGGMLLLARPDGALLAIALLAIAPSALAALRQHRPFPDFFLPGLALAEVVGGGMLGAALLLVRRRPYALEVAMGAGVALVVFELIEYWAIGFMQAEILGALTV